MRYVVAFIFFAFIIALFVWVIIATQQQNKQQAQQVQNDQNLITNCVKAGRCVADVNDGIDKWIICEPKQK